MALSSGIRLGPYEIQIAIGAGGMGEVYKARDSRLDRSVAVKVIAPEIAADPSLRARFESEARAVAALDHPNICGVYDVGQAGDTHYLVMPYLEGQTLSARVAQGPVPLAQALTIAAEMADALDKAHRHGIVHRDVKPANIMLTKAGAKLLDFGLAKLRAREGAISMSGMARMDTTPGTEHGVILGTVQYMAPEQVEGKVADARSDVWALGAVIFEMVTGARPFHGETPASVIGSILKDEAPRLSSRQPLAPRALDHLVDVCLAKDPDQRWQSAADVGRELEWIARTLRDPVEERAPARRQWFALSGWLAAAALLLALGMTVGRSWFAGSTASPAEPVSFRIYAPLGHDFSGGAASVPVPVLAVSPDGKHVVFVAERPPNKRSLWLRTLSAPDVRELPDTSDADSPFWSPDSRTVAFFSEGYLKKRDITSTAPVEVIGKATIDARGGAWSEAGAIIYALAGNIGLFKVAGTGAEPVKLDATAAVIATARWPAFLPDRERFLFQIRHADTLQKGIYVGALNGTSPRHVIDSDFGAQYADGHLLYLNGSTLTAQHYDLENDRVTGPPMNVAQPVAGASTGYPSFSASATGVLAYSNGLLRPTELRWIDRAGRSTTAIAPAADYVDFQLSPDNKRLAFARTAAESQAPDVWVADLERDTESRITAGPLTEAAAQWSPDGSRIIFRSNQSSANLQLFRATATAGAEAELIWSTEQQQRAHGSIASNVLASDWTPDGRFVIYHVTTGEAGYDLWALPIGNDPQPVAVARSKANELQGEVSPDGKWIAYTSDESGRFEIYVQGFPGAGAASKVTVSSGGGIQPRWSGNGGELFFLRADGMLMAVTIRSQPTLTLGTATPLFKTGLPAMMNAYRMDYAPAADGQRFVMKVPVPGTAPPSITVVLNWPALLGK